MNTCTKLKTAFVCLAIAGVFSGCVSSGPKHVKLATVDSSGTNVVHDIASGPFQPTWESLTSQYQTPDWFRDAKFGIWAHWGPQCEPEHGDWYARNMYMPGQPDYKSHLAEYGHPSTNGFKDVCLLYTSPSPRDGLLSRMPSSA